jgi:Zn-dependent membrane protease YugP
MFSSPLVLAVVIAAQTIITFFAVITLPVEIDASRRGLAYIESARLTGSAEEYGMAKDALTWAGLTYVVAALASIAQLAYFLLMSSRRR